MIGAKLEAVAEADELLGGGEGGEDIGDGYVVGRSFDAVDGSEGALFCQDGIGAELVGGFHDVFSSSKVS